MVGKQIVTKDQLEAFGRKLKRSISGASVTTVQQTVETITNFTELADVPQAYTAMGNWLLRVKSTVDQVEFAQLLGTANQVAVAQNAADITLSAVPQFILSDASAAPYVKLVNASDTARDPVFQWAVGASPVVKFTMGVDDSDTDAWKLSAGAALGTTDRIVVGSDGAITLNSEFDANTWGIVSIANDPSYGIHLSSRDLPIVLDTNDVAGGSQVALLSLDALGEINIWGNPTEIVAWDGTDDHGHLFLNVAGTIILFGEASFTIDSPTTTILKGQELRFQGVDESHSVGFEAPALTANVTWVLPATDSTGIQVMGSDGSGNLGWYNLSAAAAHDILSASHGDTTAAAVQRGDIIVGIGATPKWTRYATVAAGSYLASGTEPAWATLNQAAVDGLKTSDSPTFTAVNVTGAFSVDSVQVVSNRVVDADFANIPDSGDLDTDDLIDKMRDALITHGLIASA